MSTRCSIGLGAQALCSRAACACDRRPEHDHHQRLRPVARRQHRGNRGLRRGVHHLDADRARQGRHLGHAAREYGRQREGPGQRQGARRGNSALLLVLSTNCRPCTPEAGRRPCAARNVRVRSWRAAEATARCIQLTLIQWRLFLQIKDYEQDDPAMMAHAYKMTWIWAGANLNSMLTFAHRVPCH